MLKLWGRLNSINVLKVVLALEEIGLDYERTDAGLSYGVNNTPEYRAMNPNGLVPTIDDDGFVLWESNAIVRYLCAVHAAGRLWPEDPRVRADADRWMDWQTTTLNSLMVPSFAGLVRTPPEKRNAEAIETSRSKTDAAVGLLDAKLEGQDYIAGGSYSMADIALAPIMHRWLNMPVERSRYENVARWYANVMARPVSSKVLTLPIT
ncbi:MAG: glutathione S-transferase family protein [Beijerinckiaceae bacterium]|nr:glutathione S-transferase family protein [Beijerinckiaceae bacterium]MDO9440491.1 glutathione S-transferase family protein [Beijerinckiaceae bacterium]